MATQPGDVRRPDWVFLVVMFFFLAAMMLFTLLDPLGP